MGSCSVPLLSWHRAMSSRELHTITSTVKNKACEDISSYCDGVLVSVETHCTLMHNCGRKLALELYLTLCSHFPSTSPKWHVSCIPLRVTYDEGSRLCIRVLMHSCTLHQTATEGYLIYPSGRTAEDHPSYPSSESHASLCKKFFQFFFPARSPSDDGKAVRQSLKPNMVCTNGYCSPC